MIHTKWIFTALALLLTLGACTDDDSTQADYRRVCDIAISGLENSYAATAYLGEHLKINPIITTKNSDDAMTYQWLLYSSKTGTVVNGDTIRPTVIANTRDLDYEVAMAPGAYQLRLLATDKQTGYTVYATTDLSVSTSFSEGFYVLKETADGNTELDQLTAKGMEAHDLLTKTDGNSLKGKPASIWPIYDIDYINPDDKSIAQTNALAIVTDDGDAIVKRTTDFRSVFDRNNLYYGKMDDSEKIYGFFATDVGYHYLVTSSGLRYTTSTGKSTGQYGNPVNTVGGCAHIACDITSYGSSMVWDEKAQSLMVTDYNGNASPLTFKDQSGEELTQNLSGFSCRHIGYNLMNRKGTFTAVLSNGTKNYLYLVAPAFSGTLLLARKQLNADSHLAHATSISTCGNMAKYIYGVDGGKLYACNFAEDNLPETQLYPEGVPADETINFITNQYWQGQKSGGTNFDYLIVGTQKGSNYVLRFYEMNGGVPVGKPVKTIRGEGSVKMVRYVYTHFNTTDWQFFINAYSITD